MELGTVFIEAGRTDRNFTVRVEGLASHARVSKAVMGWDVKVFDSRIQDSVVWATVGGSNVVAAHTVAGLMAGYAHSYGLPAILPTDLQIREWLHE